jgi:acyl-CoA hydrolase
VKIHGMTFSRPIRKGDLVAFNSRIVLTGETKMVSYIEVIVREKVSVNGFITFVHVDLDGKPQPHGLNFVPVSEDEIRLNLEAQQLC